MNVPGSEHDRPARRHPQFGHPRRAQADAHDRRLRAAILRLQLLRHGRLQPRRIRHHPQDVEDRLARHARPPINPRTPSRWRPQNENPRSNRDGAEPRQVHRVPYLLASPARTCGPAAKAWNTRGSTTSRPSPASAIRRTGKTRSAGRAAGRRKRNGKIEPRIGGKWRVLANIFANPDLPEIDDYYEPFTFDYRASAEGAGNGGDARRRGRAR